MINRTARLMITPRLNKYAGNCPCEMEIEMTEKEKMINGMMYDANCEELLQDRIDAKEKCYDYNNLRPSETAKRTEQMKKILGKIKGDFTIEPSFVCDYGYNIEIGDNFYSNHNLVILDGAKVKFGDNVWIGGGVHVMPGVTIGNNVVIGGGSVVVNDIPDDSVAVGNPCKVIREIHR